MSEKVHPFEGALLMIEDLRAKEAETYDAHKKASEALYDAERELTEIIKPFMKKAEKFLAQVAREETSRPKADVFFNTWAGSEKGINVDIIVAARLSEAELGAAAVAVTERFSQESIRLTGLDPKHFSFRVYATRTIRRK